MRGAASTVYQAGLLAFDQDSFDLGPWAAGTDVGDHNCALLKHPGIAPAGPNVKRDPAPQLGGFILERVVRFKRTLVFKDTAHFYVQGAFAVGGRLDTIKDPDILLAELLQGHRGLWARQLGNFPFAVRLVEHPDHNLFVGGRMVSR